MTRTTRRIAAAAVLGAALLGLGATAASASVTLDGAQHHASPNDNNIDPWRTR